MSLPFLDSIRFQEEIEDIVTIHRLNHFEAVLFYLKENEIDPEEISDIISPNLRAKIYACAMMDGHLKKEEMLDC